MTHIECSEHAHAVYDLIDESHARTVIMAVTVSTHTYKAMIQ
jgi:hypothetical protein